MNNEQPTTSERIADRITSWSGTMTFLVINAALFACWIAANTLTPFRFDPYPFQALTMMVSLEAIFLAVFVLISQNRQVLYDRRINERDAAVNREAKRDIAEMKASIEAIKKAVLP